MLSSLPFGDGMVYEILSRVLGSQARSSSNTRENISHTIPSPNGREDSILLCSENFKQGDLLIETDFIEKCRHTPKNVRTCDQHVTPTMMVALVHHSTDGKGVHETEAWVLLLAREAA